MPYFLTLFWRELYMFWTGLLCIIRSLNTVLRLLMVDSKPVQNM